MNQVLPFIAYNLKQSLIFLTFPNAVPLSNLPFPEGQANTSWDQSQLEKAFLPTLPLTVMCITTLPVSFLFFFVFFWAIHRIKPENSEVELLILRPQNKWNYWPSWLSFWKNITLSVDPGSAYFLRQTQRFLWHYWLLFRWSRFVTPFCMARSSLLQTSRIDYILVGDHLIFISKTKNFEISTFYRSIAWSSTSDWLLSVHATGYWKRRIVLLQIRACWNAYCWLLVIVCSN